MTIELCPPPPMSSYAIQAMAILLQAVQVLQNAQIFLCITKLEQCHHPHQDPLLSFTTLFSCRITLYIPHQMPPPTCTLVCHPNPPDSTHRLLLALEFLLPLSAVLLHFHLRLLLCLLQTPGLPWRQKESGVGVNPPTHTKCDSKGQFFPESYSDFSQPTRC